MVSPISHSAANANHFALSYYSEERKAGNEKMEIELSHLPIRVRHRIFSAWGIQTGPFAALEAHFVLKIVHLFHFHTGEPILITPEG